MRASRLVSLLLLLQLRGRLSAAELAERLEVSVRTVYRDVDALQEAGVPILSARGPAGGYRLRENYRTRLTGLTAEEAEALFLAGLPGPAAELGLGSIVAAAELKVLAALPEELRVRAERAGRLFHLDAPGWFREPEETPALAGLAGAVWHDRRVAISYRGARRVLDPLGLVLKGGAWYLVAHVDAGVRVYRVSRIAELDVLDESFERPDFDLPGFWAERTVEFESTRPRLEVTVRRGGGVETLVFEQLDHAYTELMPLGSAVEVLDPPELRERIATAAAELAALYASGATSIAITSNQT